MADKAIALIYDEKSSAPRLSAKAEREMAARMIEIARQNGVPVVESEELSELLYSIDLETSIPENLYLMIAEIYRFIWSIQEES